MKITIEQAQKRLSSLPPEIREVLFSFDTALLIKESCSQNGLTDKIMGDVAVVSGWVILGLIRISDLAQELQLNAGLDEKTSKNVAAALENKIFNSIRADLEKIYAPPDSTPVKMEEIRPGTPPKPISGAANEPATSQSIKQAPPAPQFSRPSFIKDTHGAPLPEPKPLSDLIKPKVAPPATPSAPLPPIISGAIPAVPAPSVPVTAVSKPVITGAAAPISGLGAKFEGRTISPAPTSLPSQAPLRPAMAAAPKLDIRFGPMVGGEISKLGATGMPGSGTAKIEIGSIKQNLPNSGLNAPTPAKEQMAQKIVHYSQWKTPVIPPTVNTAPAQTGPMPLQHVISGQSAAPAQNLAGHNLPPPPPPPLKKQN